MKHMTKDELRVHVETIPLGYTYDHNGNVLSFRGINGDWSEYTRDAQSRVLTYKDSYGCWRGFSNEDIDKERARLKQVRKNLKRCKK